RAGNFTGIARQMAHQRPGERALAGAGLSDEAQYLAWSDLQRNVVQHTHRASGRDVVECIILDRKYRGHRSSFGLRASRRPSPTRLKAMAVSAIAAEGAINPHGAGGMYWRASATMSPHSDAGGWAPTPRKLSVANSMTAKDTRMVDSITIGAMTLGNISRKMIHCAPSPRAMAALT